MRQDLTVSIKLIFKSSPVPPIKKPRRKVYSYQKGDYESSRSDALQFAKERYFNGYSDSSSVQENVNSITSFEIHLIRISHQN